MVRFARLKGAHAKSSFNKVPEEASSWAELKEGGSEGDHEVVSEVPEDSKPKATEPKEEKVEAVWSEFEPTEKEEVKRKKKSKQKTQEGGDLVAGPAGPAVTEKKKKKSRLEKEAEGVEFKRRKTDNNEFILSFDGEEIKLSKFDGYLVTEEDAEKLEQLREKLKKQGEDEKKIYAMVKMERRKAERFVKLKKKNLCFHCRKGGHNLSDCPELEKDGVPVGPASGICFKCGSTEHRLPQCKSRSHTLEYATCFVCGQTGHLSKNCTNNPRGLYPDGGGCKSCGDVTHYERDCPELAKRKRKVRQEVVSAKMVDRNDVEALDYDDEWARSKKVLKIDVKKKGPNKIVKF